MAILVGCWLLCAPGASADPPGNDHFADREVLDGGLPIEVERGNVEATKEAGEFISGFSAGHSVWFEWEAESTEWVTIGACETGFPTILAVFTGTELEHLTQAVSGNSSEGPDCPFRTQQYTFRASAGSTYVIAVDGNSFYLPPAEPPSGEGEFTLRIESRAAPPNDLFAAATPLAAPVDEEPDGRRSYFAGHRGYNWNATSEEGETIFGADSGASVWYSWTPPEDGTYRVHGPCCEVGLDWGLFAGDSLGGLSPVLTDTAFAEVEVTAATTYRIAVWGTPDLEMGEPTMSGFDVRVVADLPPLEEASGPKGGDSAGPPLPPPWPPTPRPGLIAADVAPPDTKISRRLLKSRPPTLVFRFHATEPGATFRCKLNRRRYARCGSRKQFRCLRRRRHVLRVVAIDASGNRDRSPAVARFKTRCTTKSLSHHNQRR